MWWLLSACAHDHGDATRAPVEEPLQPVMTCPAEEARLRAEGTWFRRLDDAAWTDQHAGTPEAPGGEGVAVADLDGDGVLDVLVPSPDGDTRLFIGQLDEGTWRPLDETSQRLPDLTAARARAAAAADFDGDGDPDLFLGTDGADVVLRNDGSGVFSPLPGTDPSAGDTFRTSSIAFGVDPEDHALLAFVSNYVELEGVTTNRILRWRDAGTTPHPTPLTGPLAGGMTFAMLPVDVDGDGAQEVLVFTDKILPAVHRWQGGALVPYEDAELSGRVASVMGAAQADLNRDGRPDFLYPAYGETSAAESVEGGWVDSAAARGFVVDPANGRHVAWGALAGDLDNDGDVDAVVAYGPHDAGGDRDHMGNLLNPLRQPYSVLLADSAGVLRESAGDLRLADPLGGRGSVLADLDQDGWLDLVRRDVLGPPLLDLSLCGDAHWLVVELEDAPPNVHAIGARVRVDTASGTRTGWVTAGGPGYASSGPPEVHVGLGDETDIAGIVITWPDGSETRHAPVAVNQRVRLTR